MFAGGIFGHSHRVSNDLLVILFLRIWSLQEWNIGCIWSSDNNIVGKFIASLLSVWGGRRGATPNSHNIQGHYPIVSVAQLMSEGTRRFVDAVVRHVRTTRMCFALQTRARLEFRCLHPL